MGKKNISKLTKKVITNKKGHRTTVWVKTGDEQKPKKKSRLRKVVEKIKSDLSKSLYKKVKREGKGKGGQIQLSSAETKELLEKGRLGFISAGINPADPNDVKLSPEDVVVRDKQLKADLIEKGFKFIPVLGKYGEEEDSYMVMIPEIEKDELNELGKKYNQDSVIYSDHNHNELMFTTGENEGKHNDGEGYEELTEDTDDFFTEVKTTDGVYKFRFNIDFDKLLKAFGSMVKILRI